MPTVAFSVVSNAAPAADFDRSAWTVPTVEVEIDAGGLLHLEFDSRLHDRVEAPEPNFHLYKSRAPDRGSCKLPKC